MVLQLTYPHQLPLGRELHSLWTMDEILCHAAFRTHHFRALSFSDWPVFVFVFVCYRATDYQR